VKDPWTLPYQKSEKLSELKNLGPCLTKKVKKLSELKFVKDSWPLP
jgi:hypothetical protein